MNSDLGGTLFINLFVNMDLLNSHPCIPPIFIIFANNFRRRQSAVLDNNEQYFI